VITTAPKAKPKPSVQTEFMLTAMADATKREEERWVKMQVSIDILTSKVDSQGETQQQMAVQIDIATQALTQSVKDRLTLTQQLAATSDMVARLVADRCQDGGREGPGAHSGFFGGHQQEGAPMPPTVRHWDAITERTRIFLLIPPCRRCPFPSSMVSTLVSGWTSAWTIFVSSTFQSAFGPWPLLFIWKIMPPSGCKCIK
jgi:hypothetical protein